MAERWPRRGRILGESTLASDVPEVSVTRHPFALVLHTHLPMVINHGRWPHGSDWLSEATFECYLPLLPREESIHLQLRTAVETHRRHFGVAPRGIWLPECAYRPRYEWTPPTGRDRGREHRIRPGIEEMLAVHGLEYFVVDHHLVAGGPAIYPYRDFVALPGDLAVETPQMPRLRPRTPYRPYRVVSRGGPAPALPVSRAPKST